MSLQATVSKAQFARDNGWSRSYVSKLVRNGKLTPEPDGSINPKAAEQELQHTTGYTLHGRCGRSLADEEDDDTDPHDRLMASLWLTFYRAADELWKELRHGSKSLERHDLCAALASRIGTSLMNIAEPTSLLAAIATESHI